MIMVVLANSNYFKIERFYRYHVSNGNIHKNVSSALFLNNMISAMTLKKTARKEVFIKHIQPYQQLLKLMSFLFVRK